MMEALPEVGVGLVAFLFAILAGLLGILASIHALLYKRRPRAAFGWIAVCLTFPLAGAALYYWFGINRARRRARLLRDDEHVEFAAEYASAPPEPHRALARLGETVSGQPLLVGHDVEVLHCGEAAYPAMLAAIEGAAHRVYLVTYIFDTDETGRRFADALGRAVERGVDVRVLLDGFGELYTLPRARRMLRKRGINVRRFLPPRLLPPSLMVNLRNHRKILLIDDDLAFSGGMNISDRHLVGKEGNAHRVVDVHFAIRGPVTLSLLSIFLSDWYFAGGREPARPGRAVCGGSGLCRAIADGPDEEIDRLLILIVGAIGLARHRVAIMTPYFVPPRELIGALQAAALRGVDVSILLPGRNNLFFMHRATRHLLWELLQRGVRVYYQPAPFVHSKFLLVDDDYAQVGSANLDPRSLRLNFELTLEIYDAALVARLDEHYAAAMAGSEEVHLADVDGRRMPTRMLDGLAWLFSPYL
jgi:cardiolipin synthase A/B